jgi:uncharacterized protein YdhG (YjbR/CyaY superfamily)
MAKSEIDDYLNNLDEPKRSTLGHLRDMIVAIVPDAEQGISYGVPAFRLEGKTIAGFAAFKNHLSYLPHGGRVIGRLENDTEEYAKTKGALHFAVDEPLPETLVTKLLDAGLSKLSDHGHNSNAKRRCADVVLPRRPQLVLGAIARSVAHRVSLSTWSTC